ncbi:MAG: glycosyltransferase [Acidobacteriota bacterium]
MTQDPGSPPNGEASQEQGRPEQGRPDQGGPEQGDGVTRDERVRDLEEQLAAARREIEFLGARIAADRARGAEQEHELGQRLDEVEGELDEIHASKMWKLWMLYLFGIAVLLAPLRALGRGIEALLRQPGLFARLRRALTRRLRWLVRGLRVVWWRLRRWFLNLLLVVPHTAGRIYLSRYSRERFDAARRRREEEPESLALGPVEEPVAAPREGRRPRVLMVSPYPIYPVNHGGAVRLFHLIREISRSVDLYLLVFSRQKDNREQREALEPYCAGLYFYAWQPILAPDFWGLRAPGVQLFRSPAVTRRLQQLISEKNIDILQLEYTELGQYAPRVAVPRKILTEIDITFRSRYRRRRAGFHRRYRHDRVFGTSRGDGHRLFRYEVEVCETVDQVHVMSEDDGRYLASFLSDRGERIRVVPNAVDTQRLQRPSAAPRPDQVLFLGNFQHLPNVDAVDFLLSEIWPQVRQRLPGATLNIVGVGPPDHVLGHHGRDGVEVLGAVPDVLPYFVSHRVFVAPIRAGSGTRLKILEAFSAGLPVVSTTVGAEGIRCRDGQHLLLAESAEAIADAIVRLLEDEALGQRLATSARELVEAEYDWRASAERLVSAYWELMPEPDRVPRQRSTSGPAISVILPTRNGGPLLEETLAAIFEQRIDREFEVLCVDSGSRPEDVELMGRFPLRFIAIDPADFNHGLTRDFGASKARGEVLVFLNQDATPVHRHWLERITEPLFSGDDHIAGVQGGIQEREHGMRRFYWDSCGERFYFTRESDRWIESFDGIGFSTVNAALRRDVWQRHPFGFAPIMEDKKWQREVVEAGYRLEVRPEALAAHTHDYDLRTLMRRCLSEGYGWRLLEEPYGVLDMLRDMFQPHMAADWVSGLFQGRIRTPAEFFFPWIRPLMLHYGNRWSRGVKL